MALWCERREPREQHLVVEAAGLKASELRPFAPGVGRAVRPAFQGIPCSTLTYPDDVMAKAFLAILAKHPNPEEHGPIEILAGLPADPTQAQYMPSLVPHGNSRFMDRVSS